ncbi:MAG: hypothetical protein U5K77_03125 [Candidatus Saccharibacteria bacterium]|nr:hypothetical protein [Candidatus Saccharibacteria bacterium]
MKWKKTNRTLLLSVLLIVSAAIPVAAQTPSSSNYSVDEYFFGTGGEVDMNSDNFNAQGSSGSLGVGESSSAGFRSEAGFLSQNAPFLEFVVQSNSVDLGTLDVGSTASGDANFYVRTYLSSSYSIITLSDPPTNGSVELDGMATTDTPSVGTEQFGINLVENTTPNIGANPTNVPDDDFADGAAAAGYNVADQFRYGKGETIAQSPATAGNQAVGQTNYTISYVANVSSITPGGAYVMEHELAAVPTF